MKSPLNTHEIPFENHQMVHLGACLPGSSVHHVTSVLPLALGSFFLLSVSEPGISKDWS
jgi:hypothetical protein